MQAVSYAITKTNEFLSVLNILLQLLSDVPIYNIFSISLKLIVAHISPGCRLTATICLIEPVEAKLCYPGII